MSRPRECGFSTEDLECLGCGCKLALLKGDQCGYEDWEKQQKSKTETAERKLLAELKAKYEPQPAADDA